MATTFSNVLPCSGVNAAGPGLLIVPTTTPGTLIHTPVALTAAQSPLSTFDEVTIDATNTGAVATVTIEFGGTSAGFQIKGVAPLAATGVPSFTRLVDAKRICRIVGDTTSTVAAFASVASVVALYCTYRPVGY